MKSKLWRWIVLTVIVLSVTATVIVKCRMDHAIRPVSTREEIAVAETLLARKLSGPRYFNAPLTGIGEEDGPWIEVDDALQQVERIATERKSTLR